jgi:type VI secretion system protein ImpA
MAIKVDDILKPVSDDSPCGPDLEYDPAFTELEMVSQFKPEQVMGDSVIPAQEPDWRSVRQKADELLTRTKDLRVIMHLTRAALRMEGLGGLRDGLKAIHGVLEQYWDTVHPQLDPDDNNDPTMRVNVLLGLCDDTTIQDVRLAPVVESKVLGRFTLRDHLIAAGEIEHRPAEGQEAAATPPTMAAIDAAFMDAPVEAVQETAKTIDEAATLTRQVEAAMTEKVGAGNAVPLTTLSDELRRALTLVNTELGKRGVSGVGEAAAPADDADAGAGGGPREAIKGEVNSREDVLRVLDKVIAYYERHEPSSPLWLFMKAGKVLVSENFLSITRKLPQDLVDRIVSVAGLDSGEGGGSTGY